MITRENAIKKAKQQFPQADTCIEYDSVYVFYNSKARGADREDNEMVIKKSDGNIISYTQYVMTTNDTNKRKISKI